MQMTISNIQKQLDRIEDILKGQVDKPLSFNEASKYLNLSKSYLYKLTSRNDIPYYKPNGKLVYFSKLELDKWILKNPIKTKKKIEQMAESYVLNER